MCGNLACLVSALLGIDAGWRPLPEGGWIYLIQIEPHVVQRLKSGEIEALHSNVPPEVKDVRAYRVTVGTVDLPRRVSSATEGDSARVPVTTVWKPSVDPHAAPARDADRVASTEAVPLPAGGVEYRIRLRTDALDELKDRAVVVQGDIPAELKDVRAYRITVGEAEAPPSEHPPGDLPLAEASPSGSPSPIEGALPTESTPPAESIPPSEPQVEPPATDPFPMRFGPPPHADALAQSRFNAGAVDHAPQWEAPATSSLDKPGPAGPSPAALEDGPDTGKNEEPIEARQLAYIEPVAATPRGESSSPSDQLRMSAEPPPKTAGQSDPDKPWLPLTIALLTLFGSLAGNVYLGWITWDTRGRFRALQRQVDDEPLS